MYCIARHNSFVKVSLFGECGECDMCVYLLSASCLNFGMGMKSRLLNARGGACGVGGADRIAVPFCWKKPGGECANLGTIMLLSAFGAASQQIFFFHWDCRVFFMNFGGYYCLLLNYCLLLLIAKCCTVKPQVNDIWCANRYIDLLQHHSYIVRSAASFYYKYISSSDLLCGLLPS